MKDTDTPTIAVLAFSGDGDEPGSLQFARGVSEDIISELSRFRELHVIAASSSFEWEAFGPDSARPGRELQANYVLEGRVRRGAGRVRITAQLIETETGDRVWTDRQDVEIGDVLEAQAEIASRICGSLVPELEYSAQRRVERRRIEDLRAFDLALQACTCIATGMAHADPAPITEGIALAERAIGLDPLCVRAHYALAWGHLRRAALGFFGAAAQSDFERANEAALRLRDLDRGNHGAYAILGHIAMRRLQHQQALANLRHAHTLNPSDVITLRWLSWVESNFGLADEARRHAELSIRLSPRDRNIDQSYWALALSAFVAGDHETCAANARQAVALNSNFSGHQLLLAACCAERGELDEARAIAASICAQAPGLLESRVAGQTYFAREDLASRYQRALALAAGVSPPDTPPPPAASAADAGPSRPVPPGPLSMRERQVLSLVARGMSNPEIATELDLSEHTVKRHVANILTKLELPNRASAVATAARLGLLQLTPEPR